MPAQNQNPLLRIFFLCSGLLCLILAGFGVALPGLPTTPFLLLAAACFARSSPRLHRWLLANKFCGPMIKNWEETRSIPRRAKLIGIASLVCGAFFSLYSFDTLSIKLALLVVLTIPLVILLRLKETESLVLSSDDKRQP